MTDIDIDMDGYYVGIDTHKFKIELDTLSDVRDMLNYIESNIEEGVIYGYSTKERTLDRIDTSIESFDISNLPTDRYIPETQIEMFLTNNNFMVKRAGLIAFKYNVYRDRGRFGVTFKFFGLTQYNIEGDLSFLSKYRNIIYRDVFGYIDSKNLPLTHTQLDVCVDIIDGDDFFKYDVIGNNGKYRKWDRVETRTRNRYSKERTIQDGVHIKDTALYTNQLIINIYDKGAKNNIHGGMVRIEYKLLQKGIDKITNNNGSINYDELTAMLRRYRILKFASKDSRRGIMSNYLYKINHDKDGNEVHRNTYYKKRTMQFPKLNKYIIDTEWLRDVEDIVIDNLYT